MVLYQYCIHDSCSWTAQWGGGSAADDPATEHALSTGHTVRGGASALHSQRYYRQQNGGNVTDDAPTEAEWPLSHVAPGEVPRDPSDAERTALYAELNALRQKVDEWSCDECGERMQVCTRGVDGPGLCRECAGFTSDCEQSERSSEGEGTQAQFVTEQDREAESA